jgi:hypothetical protein
MRSQQGCYSFGRRKQTIDAVMKLRNVQEFPALAPEAPPPVLPEKPVLSFDTIKETIADGSGFEAPVQEVRRERITLPLPPKAHKPYVKEGHDWSCLEAITVVKY